MVYLAIPTVDGKVNYKTASTALAWQHAKLCVVRFYEGFIPHDSARNKIVSDFLETDCSHLLMMDDDIIPPPNTLTELLKADVDVIAPVCWTMKDGPTPMTLKEKDGKPRVPHLGEGIERVDVVGGGMTLVKHHVYERIGLPAYEFIRDENGITKHSEDFDFCFKCAGKGIKIHAHYGITCGHAVKCQPHEIYA